jgi:uncharacterized protein YacL
MPRHDPAVIRRATRIARLAGAVLGLLGGIIYAGAIIPNSSLSSSFPSAAAALLGSASVGLIFGFLIGPTVSVEPYLWLERTLDTAAPSELAAAAVGLIVALLVGVLVSIVLSGIRDGIGYVISVPLTGVLVYVFVSAALRRRGDFVGLLQHVGAARPAAAPVVDPLTGPPPLDGEPVVLDSSALIDGRVLDVARTGFIPGRLLIPGFVLEEVQRVADSGEPLRRAKGRRGLNVVEALTHGSDVVTEIVDIDFPGTPEVDARLVRLARARGASIMTSDFNLNRVARIEGVRVLNLNELANALKPIVATGEQMTLSIVKEGKELHQGVGYLEDGTMVVVENGRRHLDQVVTVTVTSVLQTPAGRMIFAVAPPPEGQEERRAAHLPAQRVTARRSTRAVKS